ncbi:MAG: hypothetical protein ABFS12_11145 [Bacteroidota bacterium]
MPSQLKIIFLIIFTNTLLFAQISKSVSSVTFGNLRTGHSVEVLAELVNPRSVVSIQIVYKSFQDIDFKVRDMEIIGSTANYIIPGEDVSAPLLSYYLIIKLNNGYRETYPQGIPDFAKPIDLTINGRSDKDKEILFLSPSEGEVLSLEDIFISVSLVQVPEIVDVNKTKVFLSGEDITSKITFAGDLLLFYPENFPGTIESGSEIIEIEIYDKEGKLYHSTSREFTVTDTEEEMKISQKYKYSGSVIGEMRNEYFNAASTIYNNIGLTLKGQYNNWQIKGYGYLTSEENQNVQPQNRYSLTLSNNWLNLRGGDSYPRYTDLLLSGKRVRGIDGTVNFGAVSLQSSYGQTRRGVEGFLRETYTSDNTPLVSNVIKIDSAKHGNPYGMVDFGVYGRDLLIGRMAFGSQSNILVGLSFLHSKDDVHSIEFGLKPQENLATGADILMSFDNRNIVIKGEAAVSILNSDISYGSYPDSQIDSILSFEGISLKDTRTLRRLNNSFGSIMTVNQFIEPLNFTELSSLATEGTIELNYFSNNLNASYIYRGNQFVSFGQEYTRTDIQGFNIHDRIRLANNQLFLTVGYENLNDNLQKTKPFTTTFQTFRLSASLFLRANVPNITMGYIRNDNSNGISPRDTLNLLIDDVTNRFTLNLGYDFDLRVRHNTSLSFMASNRDDNGYYNSNANYLSTSFSLNSFWTKNLLSSLSITYYDSKISTVKYTYTTLSAGGRYRMLQDNLELSLYYNPSFGDFQRQSLDLVASYQLIKNLWLKLQMRYYNMKQSYNNSIAGLTVRYNF